MVRVSRVVVLSGVVVGGTEDAGRDGASSDPAEGGRWPPTGTTRLGGALLPPLRSREPRNSAALAIIVALTTAAADMSVVRVLMRHLNVALHRTISVAPSKTGSDEEPVSWLH